MIASTGSWLNFFAKSKVYNSTLSGKISLRFIKDSIEGLINNETRILFCWKFFTTSINKVLYFKQSHPNEDVSASGGSGTRVTWSGLIFITSFINLVEG